MRGLGVGEDILDEESVKHHVKNWLKERGCEIVVSSPKRGRTPTKSKGGRKPLAATPPDIKAKKGTDYYFVEVKGDPANSNAFYTAVGQLVTKMAAKTQTKYAVAFSPSYQKFVHLMPPEVQKRFKIQIIVAQPEKEKTKRLPEIIEI
jgi:Holliday junction resolvase